MGDAYLLGLRDAIEAAQEDGYLRMDLEQASALVDRCAALEARIARLRAVAVAADGAASHVSNGAWYAALRTALAALQDGDLKEGA